MNAQPPHTGCAHCPDFLLLILAFFLPLEGINLHDGSDLNRSVDYSLLSLLWSATALKKTQSSRSQALITQKQLNCIATLVCSSA